MSTPSIGSQKNYCLEVIVQTVYGDISVQYKEVFMEKSLEMYSRQSEGKKLIDIDFRPMYNYAVQCIFNQKIGG
ncbi:MAG: hypothetical protein PHC69_03940 [Ruminiclostridium sp.]|nr:hypothetical protein [Ruminiclostridium sp.]